MRSFELGNVLKNGVPVAIVGAPNTGKSTLLNQLLGEERAIVSNIAGALQISWYGNWWSCPGRPNSVIATIFDAPGFGNVAW